MQIDANKLRDFIFEAMSCGGPCPEDENGKEVSCNGLECTKCWIKHLKEII